MRSRKTRTAVSCGYTMTLFLWFLWPVLLLANEGELAPKKTYIFGVLPAFSTERLVSTFEPLVDYISHNAKLRLKLETAPDFREFVRRTHEERRYDFLLTAPHLYQLAFNEAGYIAIARVDGKPLSAVIVVPRASAITNVSGLKGHSVATIDKLGLVTVLAQAEFKENGLDPERDIRLLITPSHDASLKAMLRGRTDASVVAAPFFRKRVHPEVSSRLRVVLETRGVPHTPISVAPWISERESKNVQTVLAQMSSTKDGLAVLRKLGWPGFTESDPQTYDQLKPFVENIEL